jgi:anti-sigma-K factor RskA
MMSHDEASELLGVAALNAIDAETMAAIEEHAATCPRCQSELDGYRAVAAALGNSVEELPEGLWTNISSQLWERKGESVEMPPLLYGVTPAEVVAIGSATRTSRRLRNTLGALTFAAAASIVVLALSLSSAQNHVTNLEGKLAFSSRSVVQRALKAPGHQIVNLTSDTDAKLAEFVMLPDGTGYLVKSNMPGLSADKTYQLWGIVNGSPVSIGVMGSSPGQVTFTLDTTPSPSELAVTVQQAGGSLTPAKNFVASGPVVAT